MATTFPRSRASNENQIDSTTLMTSHTMNFATSTCVLTASILLSYLREAQTQEMSLKQRFDLEATRWEQWCELSAFDTKFQTCLDHDSFRELSRMGKDVVPLVFNRWSSTGRELPSNPLRRPPWWLLLERITNKKMVSDAEKLESIPMAVRAKTDPANVDIPSLQEQRWLKWWQSEQGAQKGTF